MSTEKTGYVKRKELTALCVAAFGQNMIYTMMSSYVSDFYINVLQAPLIFVLILMFAARIWDAINDPLMGMFVDGHVTKYGKMKPYIIFAALPIAALSFFMFFDPGFSTTGTMIYAALIYLFWGMTYTVGDVPFWSLPNVMTPLPDERAKVISAAKVFGGIGTAIPIALFTVLGFVLPHISDKTGLDLDRQKYMILAIISVGFGAIMYVSCFFRVKERVVPPLKTIRRGVMKRIFKCKPLMIVIIMGVLAWGRYMMQASAIHVARYAFYIGPAITAENATAAIQSSITVVNLVLVACAAIGMFSSMIIVPFFYKKYDYRRIIIFSCIMGVAASMVVTALGAVSIYLDAKWAFYLCIPFFIIQSIPLGVLNTTSHAMIGDCLDYMEWQTGFRDNALGNACQSFVNKFDNAVATTLIIIMYLAISLSPADIYSSGAVVAATDLSMQQRFVFFSLISIVPGVSLGLCMIPVLFYDITGEKKEQIIKELAEKRKANGLEVE